MRNPVGKVKPESQKRTGGCVVVAHVENWSTRCIKSRVHDPSDFRDGYAYGERVVVKCIHT